MAENGEHPDKAGIRKRLDEDGFVVIRRAISQNVVEGIRSELAALVDRLVSRLADKGVIRETYADAPFEDRVFRVFEHHLDVAPKLLRQELHLRGMFRLFFHPLLLDIAEAVLGPEVRLYPNYTARPKLPDWEGTRVLWHQDGGYTVQGAASESVSGMHMVNLWTPLVPATTENGCMAFVPESHKQGVVPHINREHYLEIDPTYLDPLKERAIPMEADPGDVILFHNLLFHCGLPNTSRTVRWSVDWRYQNADEPTHRNENGHLARSRKHPDRIVSSPEMWESLSFV